VKFNVPGWTRNLTDDDEWVVRTALANVASDLERVADTADRTAMSAALAESAQRYRNTLERIEEA
jgi:vacuolar-type H+-ATPase subunit E/Vma4